MTEHGVVQAAQLGRAQRPLAGTRPRLSLAVSGIDTTFSTLSGLILAGDAGYMAYSVLARELWHASMARPYEISTILMVALSFIGAVSAAVRGEHVGLTAIANRLPQAVRQYVAVVAQACCAGFCAMICWQAVLLVQSNSGDLPVTGWSTNVLYWPLAVSTGLIAVIELFRVLSHPPTTMVVGLAACGALCLLAWLLRAPLMSLADSSALLPSALILAVAMLIGLPLAFTLGWMGLALIYLLPGLSFANGPLQMVGGVNSFTLLALPFFVFVGEILVAGGLSARLMKLIGHIVGPVRGGTGLAGVLGMFVFSGLSGAKIADVAAVGPVLAPAMKSRGHSNADVVGVLGASAAMGESIPPSLAMLVLTGTTTVSTGTLFLAGLLPAVVVGLAIIGVVLITAHAKGLPKAPRDSMRQIGRDAIGAILPIGMLVLVLGGVVFGFATPVEASSLAVLYGVLVATLVYRLPLRELASATVRAARLSGVLLFLLATTQILVWALTLANVAEVFQNLATDVGNNKIEFTLVSAAILVVAGSLFEGLPAIILFAPLLLPVAMTLGIDSAQYSVVLIMAMGVGSFLPPIGVGYFATCRVVGVTPESAMVGSLKYMAGAAVGIVVVALIPAISTFLPRVIGTH